MGLDNRNDKALVIQAGFLSISFAEHDISVPTILYHSPSGSVSLPGSA